MSPKLRFNEHLMRTNKCSAVVAELVYYAINSAKQDKPYYNCNGGNDLFIHLEYRCDVDGCIKRSSISAENESSVIRDGMVNNRRTNIGFAVALAAIRGHRQKGVSLLRNELY